MGMLNKKNGIPDDAIVLNQSMTVTGAAKNRSGTVLLAHASVAIAATFAQPLIIGAQFKFINTLGGTHTVTLPTGYTFEGTNNRATLDTAGDFVWFEVISATRVFILRDSGAAYSAV